MREIIDYEALYDIDRVFPKKEGKKRMTTRDCYPKDQFAQQGIFLPIGLKIAVACMALETQTTQTNLIIAAIKDKIDKYESEKLKKGVK